MPKKVSDEEYIRTLPRKPIGAGVLLFDTKGELLIVKPDYREDWLIPGGSVEADESPLQGAIRETKEEIGLDVISPVLAGVFYKSARGGHPDSIQCMFSGGVLSDTDIESIKLQEDEILAYKFLPIEEALSFVSLSLQTTIPASLEALARGTVAYVETFKA